MIGPETPRDQSTGVTQLVPRWIEPVTWSGVSTSADSARGCKASPAARSIRRTTSFAFGEALMTDGCAMQDHPL